MSIGTLTKDTNGDGTLDYLGETVSIAGRANVGTSVMDRDNRFIYLQDDSAGISVYFPDSLNKTKKINRGDSVIVHGELISYYQKPQIVTSSYRVVPTISREPKPIPLVQVFQNPNKYLGMLVKGEAKVTGKTIDSNFKRLTIAPAVESTQSLQVFISRTHFLANEFNFEILSRGDQITVTGIVDKYIYDESGETVYEITPRTPSDISYSSIPERYLSIILIVGIILLGATVTWIFTLKKRVKSRTRNLEEALKDKDLLMQEIHHRVKNNLSIISGLIGIQMDTTNDKKTLEVLEDSQSRIQSMAMVHDKLYQTNAISSIKLDEYIKELVEAICNTFDNKKETVEVDLDLDPIELDINKTVACGLLVNEILVNAFKHAFDPDSEGVLTVRLKKQETKAVLTIADNGPGLPDDFQESNDDSLGSMLISTFAQQLEADMDVESDESGTSFTFRFPLEED